VTLARVIPERAVCLFAMANGKVDFFNDTGGYGFISTDDGDLDDDEDVFFPHGRRRRPGPRGGSGSGIRHRVVPKGTPSDEPDAQLTILSRTTRPHAIPDLGVVQRDRRHLRSFTLIIHRRATAVPLTSDGYRPISAAIDRLNTSASEAPSVSDPIPTGCRPVDDLLGGGSSAGRHAGVRPPPAAGKTNLALAAAVEVAAGGDRALYIDTEGLHRPIRADGRGPGQSP